jgi:hypothetical protein
MQSIVRRTAVACLGLLLGGATVGRADEAAPLISGQATPGVQVQPRGPIHQAFAQPGNLTPRPGPEVARKPPPPIPEVPPDRKPAGQNVQWIPGYWQWDGDKSDYLWVSGVYRNVPPGRRWEPGSWTQAADGNWRFVDGYWTSTAQAAPQYVPEPPVSVENGPSALPPDDSSIYTPGNWQWQDQRWLWRPGYYLPAQAGQVWVGPQYIWTPSGCVYVDGYWDYPLENRGFLFAPVCFDQPYWLTPGWFYRPSWLVNFRPLWGSLFWGPYHHYWYGDFFGARFARLGFAPWNVYGRRGWDPLYNYYHWANHGRAGWNAGAGHAWAGHGGHVVTPLAHSSLHGGHVGFAHAGRVAPPIHNGFAGQRLPVVHNGGAAVVNHAHSAGHVGFAGSSVHHSAAPAHRGGGVSVSHYHAAPAHHAAVSHGGGHGGGGHPSGGHGSGGHSGGGHGGGNHSGGGHSGGHGGGGHGGHH